MAQVARNLVDQVDGFLRGKRFLIVDRDTKFGARFRGILEAAGVTTLRTSVHAPDMNAVAERFVRSIKGECLDRLILFGDAMLRRALHEYVAHYHLERNHQGLDNKIVRPALGTMPGKGHVMRRERLGGLLSYYHRRRRAS
jgi:transposase InsO family protein